MPSIFSAFYRGPPPPALYGISMGRRYKHRPAGISQNRRPDVCIKPLVSTAGICGGYILIMLNLD